jgi:hypothetical protein
MPCTKTQKVVVGLIKNSDIFYSCKHTGLGPKKTGSKTGIFLLCRNMKFEVNFGKNKAGEEVKPFQEPPETLEGYTQVNCPVNQAPDLFKPDQE